MKTKWFITGLIPLILLVGVLGWILKNGAGVEKDPAAPIEVLNIERIKVVKSGFELYLRSLLMIQFGILQLHLAQH
ncbi:hypothetical protein [Peribacillus tepidiphilus]|uniref:hypothetical protein n=1 Tax=Peribacillus tepidiphilus TaxID=2652445 RepID=UPI0030B81128